MKLPLPVAVIAIALVGACTPDPSAPPQTQATARPWPRESEKDAGLDRRKLDKIDTYLGTASSTCFAIIRDGKLVHEKYWQGADEKTLELAYSVSKSITSLVVGIAIDQGKLSLDDKASTYISQWRGTDSEDVTVRNLLANDSGREWDLTTDSIDMVAEADDKTAFSIELGQDAKPGTVWHYNNSAVAALSTVLRKATGVEPAAFAEKHLFGPLGMDNTTWPPDRAGHTETFSGVRSTCLDLARMGWMVLKKGRWDGKRIVSRAYLKEATGKPATSLNAAYGLLWWINAKGTVTGVASAAGQAEPKKPVVGRMAPDAPDDAVFAIGAGQQMVAIVPSEGIVAVRMGAVPLPAFPITADNFSSAVLDAVE